MSATVIRERDTGEVVERFDTTGMSPREVGRLTSGIGINMDWERFYIDNEEEK